MTAPKQNTVPEDSSSKNPPESAKPVSGPSTPKFSDSEYDELYSPSRPKEEQGFSPVTIAIYIVVGLLLVAGIGGSIIGLKTGPLGRPHKIVSSRSISTRTTYKTLEGSGWTLNMSMLLSPSVAYMQYDLAGTTPIKIQLLGVHYKIGNGSEIPLKLPPAYLMFEPLKPKEKASRAFWLGGSPVDAITLEMRIDDGHGIRSESLTFN
ncbi:MAG: hypothetical protein VST70_05735 [Nitrospirota bacterium]|nr:hypothetical protein [Nitrospirota bacterium]